MVIYSEDNFAANRLMAAQALAVCGDPEVAFETIYREVSGTESGYVFLHGINAFQYSGTDDRLSRADWEKFKSREWPETVGMDPYGSEYALRIINDALEIWPIRRKVY